MVVNRAAIAASYRSGAAAAFYPWSDVKRGFNLATRQSGATRWTGAELAAMGVTLLRWRPDVTYRHTHSVTGAVTTWESRALGWVQPNDDVRTWTWTIDWATADNVLDDLRDNGIRSVIDPHAFVGSTSVFTHLPSSPIWWQVAYARTIPCGYWAEVAAHVASRGDEIAGFNLINEPHCPRNFATGGDFPALLTSATLPPFDASTANFVFSGTTYQRLIGQKSFPGYRAADPAWVVGGKDPRSYRGMIDDMIAVIRAVNTSHPIIVEAHGLGGNFPYVYPAGAPSTTRCNFGGAYLDRYASNTSGNSLPYWYCPTDPTGQPIVFSIHNYAPEELQTNNFLNPLYPEAGVFDKQYLYNMFVRTKNWAAGQVLPPKIFVGECGPYPFRETESSAGSGTGSGTIIMSGGLPVEKTDIVPFAIDQGNIWQEYGWAWTHQNLSKVTSGQIVNLSPSLFPVVKQLIAATGQIQGGVDPGLDPRLYPYGDTYPILAYGTGNNQAALPGFKATGFNVVQSYQTAYPTSNTWMNAARSAGMMIFAKLRSTKGNPDILEPQADTYTDIDNWLEHTDILLYWDQVEELLPSYPEEENILLVMRQRILARETAVPRRAIYEYVPGHVGITHGGFIDVPQYVDFIGMSAYTNHNIWSNPNKRKYVSFQAKNGDWAITAAGFTKGRNYLSNEKSVAIMLEMFDLGPGEPAYTALGSTHDFWLAVVADVRMIGIYSTDPQYSAQSAGHIAAFTAQKSAISQFTSLELGAATIRGTRPAITFAHTSSPATMTLTPYPGWQHTWTFPTIEHLAMSWNGVTTIVSVNSGSVTGTGRFSGIPAGVTSVTCPLESNRTIAVAGGQFSDSWPTLGVHIYRYIDQVQLGGADAGSSASTWTGGVDAGSSSSTWTGGVDAGTSTSVWS